jgi:hypothetical protein
MAASFHPRATMGTGGTTICNGVACFDRFIPFPALVQEVVALELLYFERKWAPKPLGSKRLSGNDMDHRTTIGASANHRLCHLLVHQGALGQHAKCIFTKRSHHALENNGPPTKTNPFSAVPANVQPGRLPEARQVRAPYFARLTGRNSGRRRMTWFRTATPSGSLSGCSSPPLRGTRGRCPSSTRSSRLSMHLQSLRRHSRRALHEQGVLAGTA